MSKLIPINKNLKVKLWKASVLFLVSIFFGYGYVVLEPKEAMLLFQEIDSSLEGLADIGIVSLFLLIFFNNTIKTYLFMLSGVLFGFLPGFFIVSNGMMLGLFMGIFIEQNVGLAFFVSVLPHGVFEISASLIASAYGFLLGNAFSEKLRNGTPLKPHLSEASRYFMKYLLPLFFIAAAIEISISPFIASLFI